MTKVKTLGGSFAKKHFKKGYFHKEAADLGRKKLIDEIYFIKNLPHHIRDYFPKIVDYSIEPKKVSIKEELINLPHVRSLIFEKKLDAKKSIILLDNILTVLTTHTYYKDAIKTPKDYLDQYHFNRVWNRIEFTIKHVDYFKDIIAAKHIFFNGKKFVNVPHILKYIKNSRQLRTFLTPKKIYPFVHGDLHMQNILVNHKDLSFRLVDPRGYKYCDIYYDLGKIGHSVNSKYDFIHENKFTVNWKKRTDGMVDVNLRFYKSHAFNVYEQINKNIIDIYKKHTKDPHAHMRVLFNEAMHMSSDMPFHLLHNKTEEKALALYIMGVKALNKFISLYDKTFETETLKMIELNLYSQNKTVKPTSSEQFVNFYL